MKKLVALVLALVCVLSLAGCNNQPKTYSDIIEGNMKTYYKMDDGTWQVDGHTYQYRLEIKGRMHNAAVDSTFVFPNIL